MSVRNIEHREIDKMTNAEIIQELRKFDTATICNVVATYPQSDICLKLYDAWYGEYYTDQTVRCMYPELGPLCGYAATAWYSQSSADYTQLDDWALFDHLDSMKKPIILVAKQTYPPEIFNLSGLFGGNMTTEFKAMGVVGIVTDGPMRDYEEIKEMKVQYLATGLTSGHGPLMLRGSNIPVKVAGMAVSPGDIVHMDICGAAKFPERYLPKVLEYAIELRNREVKYQSKFHDPNFSYQKWKELGKKY
ncbi:MAG: RraA family protein [Nitrososphaeria archaeon]